MIENFKKWIINNKMIAIGAPLVVILMGAYLFYQLEGKEGKNTIVADGYNKELPYKEKELKAVDPNENYIQAQKDSILRAYNAKNGGITNIGEKSPVAKDSLQAIIDELDKFSFEEEEPRSTPAPNYRPVIQYPNSIPREENSENFINTAEEEFDKFFSTSINEKGGNKESGVNIVAKVNYDQTVKSNSRIEMILSEDLVIKGKRFPKNTYVYGICKFSGYRLQIFVSKIKSTDVSLNAYDYQDGNMGLYVDPDNIGEEIRVDGTDGIIDEADVNDIPLGNTVKRVFKKKNQESSVVLLNNYKVILKSS